MCESLKKLFGIRPRKGVLIYYSDRIREGEVMVETANHFLVRLYGYPSENDFWLHKNDSRIVEVFNR